MFQIDRRTDAVARGLEQRDGCGIDDHLLGAGADSERDVDVGGLAGLDLTITDRWLLARAGQAIEEAARGFERLRTDEVIISFGSYLDDLSNWYVRRSRDRFWEGDRDAFDTLYTVLETLSRVLAPLAPLTAEEIWRGDELTIMRELPLRPWAPGNRDHYVRILSTAITGRRID